MPRGPGGGQPLAPQRQSQDLPARLSLELFDTERQKRSSSQASKFAFVEVVLDLVLLPQLFLHLRAAQTATLELSAVIICISAFKDVFCRDFHELLITPTSYSIFSNQSRKCLSVPDYGVLRPFPVTSAGGCHGTDVCCGIH